MAPRTLADFLLARIAEDEAMATDEAIARASAGTVVGGGGVSSAAVDQAQESLVDLRRVRPWSSPFGPARVLVECDAKRRIVQMVPDLEGVLAAIALPYADHPDYDEEWRP